MKLLMRISDFRSGWKRLVTGKKLNGEMWVQEGKSPITFDGFNFVSLKALEMTEDFRLSPFEHLFLLLCAYRERWKSSVISSAFRETKLYPSNVMDKQFHSQISSFFPHGEILMRSCNFARVRQMHSSFLMFLWSLSTYTTCYLDDMQVNSSTPVPSYL